MRRLALAFVSAFVASCSAGPTTPVPPAASVPVPVLSNDPPVARLTVKISSLNAQSALTELNSVEFDASASTGNLITYRIDYGDGVVTSERKSVHTFARTFSPTGGPVYTAAKLTVTDTVGRTSSVSVNFDVMSFANGFYVWEGIGTGGWFRVGQLPANGLALSGKYFPQENPQSPIGVTGSLSGERTVHLISDDGSIEFSGELHLRDSVGGNVRLMRLTIRGGSGNGKTIDFHWHDPF